MWHFADLKKSIFNLNCSLLVKPLNIQIYIELQYKKLNLNMLHIYLFTSFTRLIRRSKFMYYLGNLNLQCSSTVERQKSTIKLKIK